MAQAKGYTPKWKPSAAPRNGVLAHLPSDAKLLRLCRAVLAEYEAFWPLTVRQVFYRLVGQHGYPKHAGSTERDARRPYEEVSKVLKMARRQAGPGAIGLADDGIGVGWDCIRDDGFYSGRFIGYADEQDFKDSVASDAADMTLDLQAGQERRVLLWCEARGMVPQLESYAAEYGAAVYSSGGCDSVSGKYQAAQALASHDGTLILHVADLDQWGEAMSSTLDQDMTLLVDGLDSNVEIERIALNQAQVKKYKLPAQEDGKGWQAEALAPPQLKAEVQAALKCNLDMDLIAARLAEQAEARKRLIAWIKK